MPERNMSPLMHSPPSRPPPWRLETPRDCYTTKVVSIVGPRCPSGPHTIEAPNTAAPKGLCTPRRRIDTSACRRSNHSIRKHHHHRHRLTSLLHWEGCQICLLNDRTSVCTKEEGDSTTNKPATTATTSHRIQQPLTQGWKTRGQRTCPRSGRPPAPV
jgi:hypothetical protein